MKTIKKTIVLALVLLISMIIFISLNTMSANLVDFKVSIIPPADNAISVLSANVGNLDLACRKFLNKLCYEDVENRIAQNIRVLSPDLIAFQEVLAPWQCADQEDNICSGKPNIPQVRRLLGLEYSILCNIRNQFECIALKKSVGTIQGCAVGEICNLARTVPTIPNCDNGFTISAGTIILKSGHIFDIINMHPQSTSQECRAAMLDAALKPVNDGGIIEAKNILILGDFNLDPWRESDISTKTWEDFFESGWAHSKFQYHIDTNQNKEVPFTTYLFGFGKTVDFAVSNFADGKLYVLGESPNTIRLDQGKGTDHRALFGFLLLK